ncbi:MAG: hypothetical protein FWG20_02110 [Candidatus Cloacimonetes bacterium]|nr:hypothetical protein [Candidatus Cloacimonadota bacterium]
MKKLITIIILALIIATATAEEIVYKEMTAEELVRWTMYTYLDYEWKSFPVIVTGEVWSADHYLDRWSFSLLGNEPTDWDEYGYHYGLGIVFFDPYHDRTFTRENYPDIAIGKKITMQAESFDWVVEKRYFGVVLKDYKILSIE